MDVYLFCTGIWKYDPNNKQWNEITHHKFNLNLMLLNSTWTYKNLWFFSSLSVHDHLQCYDMKGEMWRSKVLLESFQE